MAFCVGITRILPLNQALGFCENFPKIPISGVQMLKQDDSTPSELKMNYKHFNTFIILDKFEEGAET